MPYAIKTNNRIQAWELGSGSAMEQEMIRRGKIVPRPDGAWEIFSQEATEGSGQVAQTGDFFKVDEKGFPYPNARDYFLENHEPLGNDWYLQKTRPLKIWRKEDPDCEELRFLLDRGILSLHPETPKRYFSAFLWGTKETAPSDAVLVFFHVERDAEGGIAGIEFNFVVRDYFDLYYRVLPS